MSIGKLVSTLMEEPLATASLLTLIASLKPAATVNTSSCLNAAPGTRTSISGAMVSGATSSASAALSAFLKETAVSSAVPSFCLTTTVYSVFMAETASLTVTFVPSVIVTEVSPLVASLPPMLTTSYCVAEKVGMKEDVVTDVGMTRVMVLALASMAPGMSAGTPLFRLAGMENALSSHFPSGVSFGSQETRTVRAARLQARKLSTFFIREWFIIVYRYIPFSCHRAPAHPGVSPARLSRSAGG